MNQKDKGRGTFIWRVSSAHVIAYFIAGVFALVFMNYKVHYSSEALSLFMRPLSSPWVCIGPALQIFRGVIIALVLLPIRSFIFTKYGYIKLMWLIFGFCSVSTIGPTPGSFDGFIYTVLPVYYHLLGMPETLLYIFLFTGILAFWYKWEKKYMAWISVMGVILIITMGIMGFKNMLQV